MSGIHRFLTRRDRHGRSARQSKEEKPHALTLPLFREFFTAQATPGDGQENTPEHEKKLKAVEGLIRSMGITTLEEPQFNYALRTTNGDVEKAVSLLLLLEDAIEGIIRNYTPRTKLLGAENRQGVTCYLDALLFAMFARLDCFEAILYKAFNDEPRRKLTILLRLWVNMLRSGRLITTDVTKHIQDALAECGWKDAAMLRQQDASEAFTFITEKLELPLLTLKMDIYHTGKEDASDDHKFINERLLEVAIPPESEDGQTLTLEDCLEAYFNNRIEVKRYLERRNTLTSIHSVDSLSLSKGFTAHVEEVDTTPTLSPVQSSSPRMEKPSPWSSFSEFNEALASRKLGRRDSIVQERFIPDSTEETPAGNESSTSDEKQRKGVIRKEVMMPAWQFFSLIPWYTDNTPTNDAQVAAHFSSKRPILGMCLKRYSFTPKGTAVRLNTYIDIPTEIGLPHFIQDDNMDADAPIYGNFKLSLQAMVCHRGNSVDSGHYIAIVRGTSANPSPPGSSASSETQPTETPKHWMRFDDLATERVTLIDIEQAMKTESPYLLFYQILPVDQDASVANLPNKAPSSRASDATLDMDMADLSDISRKLMGLAVEETADDNTTEGVAFARPSFEITGSGTVGNQISSNGGRRPSVVFSETGPTGHQPRSIPSSSPRLAPMGEEGPRGFPFPRRGSRATKSNSGSRANSQSGENRISSTFSRFAGRLSKDRFTSDGEVEPDESAVEADDSLPDGTKLGLPPDESKEKGGRGRSKDRISKGKSKEKSRKPERECIVM
ncbi:uncharacterized protein N7459_008086 [Penicillium hispanicum]|uniref:uncharacterized protein n=1 Tax=Penicillium hispanicum TaxID=1080232 RepID=UPI0025419B72|nr:uncharacterized protein N7459_008086 [Penicillium hispanicum]KAJ5573659.1 hypothetical protein N7459_008086 [Penicillium hispanicum]